MGSSQSKHLYGPQPVGYETMVVQDLHEIPVPVASGPTEGQKKGCKAVRLLPASSSVDAPSKPPSLQQTAGLQ